MTSSVQIAPAVGWVSQLRLRARAARIPMAATLELTSRCNLRCRHCYLGSQEEQHRKRDLERDTAAVIASLDEWAAAGCLYLLITGGDPMVRADFVDIYRHACELGMLVTVFCDGILVTDPVVTAFREYPPCKVEISIYGATPATYEAVTRVPGSYDRAWNGIDRLLENGVRVALKTMLLTLNQHELEAMAAQAERLGCKFRYDAAVFPCLADGSEGPLEFRVPPAEVVACDMATPERRRRWARAVRAGQSREAPGQVYTCGAGATSFAVDPCGNLSPCLMSTRYRCSSRGRSFLEVWRSDLAEIREVQRTKKDAILCGGMQGACTHCPAINDLETGDEETESGYMRETARLRYEAIRATEEGRGL